MGIKVSDDKPWARLRMNRRQYEASKPWKRAGMTRAAFDKLVLDFMTDDLFEELKLNADADALLGAIFDGE